MINQIFFRGQREKNPIVSQVSDTSPNNVNQTVQRRHTHTHTHIPTNMKELISASLFNRSCNVLEALHVRDNMHEHQV